MLHHPSIRELPGRAGFREGELSLLLRVFRSPSPNHGERMIGKRYLRGCTKQSSARPGSKGRKSSGVQTRSERERRDAQWE